LDEEAWFAAKLFFIQTPEKDAKRARFLLSHYIRRNQPKDPYAHIAPITKSEFDRMWNEPLPNHEQQADYLLAYIGDELDNDITGRIWLDLYKTSAVIGASDNSSSLDFILNALKERGAVVGETLQRMGGVWQPFVGLTYEGWTAYNKLKAGPATGASSHRLAAIVVADVVGYSALIGQDEAGTLSGRKDLIKAVEAAATRHRGRVVKTMGDGFLMEFGSGVDAMSAAIDIQIASRLPLRMGLNVCEVAVDGSDIHGDGVNITQRLEGHATPGHICLPAHVMDDLVGKLALRRIDRGAATFKNIARAIHVVEVDPRAAPKA
jgi:class 3 adenylate cyclase